MKQKKEILTRRHKGHDGNASTNEDGATAFEFDIFACTAIAFVDILFFLVIVEKSRPLAFREVTNRNNAAEKGD